MNQHTYFTLGQKKKMKAVVRSMLRDAHYKRTDAELKKTLAEANGFAMSPIGKELFDLDTDDPLKTGILEYDDCSTKHLIQNIDAMNYDDFDIEIFRMKNKQLDYREKDRKERMS